MKVILTIVLLSFGTVASAEKLDDVTILDIKFVKEKFELKLQAKEQAKKNSHFIVDIVRDDSKAFEKLALVLKKQKKKEDFKLNLEILSFSAHPSGAFYRSDRVKFAGVIEGESLMSP